MAEPDTFYRNGEAPHRNSFNGRKDEAPFIQLPNRTSVCRMSSSGIDYSCFTSDILLNILIPSIDEFLKSTSLYNLSDLCGSSKVDEEYSNLGSPESFLSEWLIRKFDVFRNFKYQTEYQQVQIFTDLAPWLSSNGIKPDICLLKYKIPLFLCEVLSGSNYSSDIAKCVVSLIYQLRVLRHFDASIDYVKGFVFPNIFTPKLVTMVEVKWRDLEFSADYTYLKKESVEQKIVDVLKYQCTFADYDKDSVNHLSYFMPLSRSELELMKDILKCRSALKQVQSKFSILVKDDDYYYKLVPSINSKDTLMDILLEQLEHEKDIKHLCFPSKVLKVFRQRFFRFELQEYQFLSPNEANRCLVDFTLQTFDALEELHNLEFAHTDVRLPNIVFSKDFKLKLIDFDRARHIKSINCSFKSNFLYTAPRLATSKSLDYKQLGLLILQIHDQHYAEKTLVLCEKYETALEEKYPFLSRLIFNGDVDSTLYTEFIESLKVEKKTISIADVLTGRTTMSH